MRKIYLDYASTTPTDSEVMKAMEPFFFEKFGNASSPHTYGREAQKALEDARDVLARFLGAQSDEIVFTSGATESNNHAVIGTAKSLSSKGKHIILSRIEHHSVLEPAESLKKDGFELTYLDVDQDGLVDLDQLKTAVREDTILICVMHASNEIGTIQPIQEIGTFAKEKGIVFLVDAVQTVGHIPVDVNTLNADLLSLSAHKFYGPKGIGALYIRKGTPVARFLYGGDQEKDRRASTQNVAGSVGLARAIELCGQGMAEEIKTQTALRDKIIQGVKKAVEEVKVNGHPTQRLPNNAHFSFKDTQGEALLMSLDINGISASMGSACTSGALEPSHVLRALGLSDELAYGSLRITIGRWTKEDDVNYLLEKLPELIITLKV